MAITKIHAIKSTLGKALAYIENPDKTDGQMLVSGYNCEPQTASIDFEMTAVLAHKARNLKRKRSRNDLIDFVDLPLIKNNLQGSQSPLGAEAHIDFHIALFSLDHL